MKTMDGPVTTQPSERITWERCPVCGALAAVGWSRTDPAGHPSRHEVPHEFDCPSGCHLTFSELDRAFG